MSLSRFASIALFSHVKIHITNAAHEKVCLRTERDNRNNKGENSDNRPQDHAVSGGEGSTVVVAVATPRNVATTAIVSISIISGTTAIRGSAAAGVTVIGVRLHWVQASCPGAC